MFTEQMFNEQMLLSPPIGNTIFHFTYLRVSWSCLVIATIYTEIFKKTGVYTRNKVSIIFTKIYLFRFKFLHTYLHFFVQVLFLKLAVASNCKNSYLICFCYFIYVPTYTAVM